MTKAGEDPGRGGEDPRNVTKAGGVWVDKVCLIVSW